MSGASLGSQVEYYQRAELRGEWSIVSGTSSKHVEFCEPAELSIISETSSKPAEDGETAELNRVTSAE